MVDRLFGLAVVQVDSDGVLNVSSCRLAASSGASEPRASLPAGGGLDVSAPTEDGIPFNEVAGFPADSMNVPSKCVVHCWPQTRSFEETGTEPCAVWPTTVTKADSCAPDTGGSCEMAGATATPLVSGVSCDPEYAEVTDV